MNIVTERRVTVATANRLGRRIRERGLNPADQEQLELVLSDAFDALSAVSAVLRRDLPDVEFTPRLKTVGTIIEKLTRERTMALSRMRDIAGIRIVDEMNRVEQDVLVQRITEATGRAIPLDRRSSPSYGYRAVHVEVNCGGAFVEIQVRTRLQDLWAQVVERLGDTWGRQIRYGGDPPEPDREIVPGFPRVDLWTIVKDLSEQIDAVERAEQELAMSAADGQDEGREEGRLITATSRRDLAALLERIDQLAVSMRV